MAKLEKEYQFYRANREDFHKKYFGQVLVIVGEQIVGVYPDKITALAEAAKNHALGTFLVQKVADDDESFPRFSSRVFVP